MGVMHVRRRTTEEWTDQNPILVKDQMALDTTSGEFRIGDGQTRWAYLPSYSRGGSGGSSYADTHVTQTFLNALEERLVSLEAGDPITVIEHGSNANHPRPTGVKVVYWLGTVEPVNAVDDDLLSMEVDAP